MIEDMFGTDDDPVKLDTLVNADTVTTRTIIFKDPEEMGGSISVSGKLRLLSGATVTVTPEWARGYDKYPLDLGPWHSMTDITTTDSTEYELDISSEPSWQFGWGYAVRYRTASGSQQTEVKSVESSR